MPLVLTQPYTTAALTGDEVKVVLERQPVVDVPLGIAPNLSVGGATPVRLVFTIPLKQP